jgi:hypothetical protein
VKYTFWGSFWHSARRAYGAVVAGLALPLSVVLWLAEPTAQVPASVVIVFSTMVLGILVTLLHMAYSAVQELSNPIPRVVHARKGEGAFSDCPVVCLLEESELFSQGFSVSFYYRDNAGFEILVGVGQVLNIQDDRRILVGLLWPARGQDETVTRLRENNFQVLERLRVKPYVPHYAIGQVSGRD